MITDACKVDRLLHGPAKYYACVSSQMAALRNSPGRPDLSQLSAQQRTMIADACNPDRLLHGPAKYYACLRSQAAALEKQAATVPQPSGISPIIQLPAKPPSPKPTWESFVLKAIGFLFLLCLLWLAYIKLVQERCPVCGASKSSAARFCNSCESRANSKQTSAPNAQQQPNKGQGGAGQGRGISFNPYEVLGVPQGASKDQIRSAYVDLIARYHPDKVSHLGQEFQAIAKEKTLAINRAYKLLTRP